MLVDISSLNSMIRGYIVTTIKEYYPDMDTSENSVFDDLFIKPIIEISTPFIEQLSRLELKSSLKNIELLTDDEIDEIGENNYFISRRQGVQATTMLTLSFYNLNLLDESFQIKIPSGCTFQTASGLEFQTQEMIILNREDIQEKYNRTNLVYEIEVPVIASNVGVEYNVNAGEITTCKTFISNNLLSVINNYDVTNGKDKETNENYINRIKDFYLSRQLGTSHGYKNFVMEELNEVTDVYVSGYKDEYMERDLFKVIDNNDEKVDKHIGGMVDLYLKGCLYSEMTRTVTLNNDILALNCRKEQLSKHGTSELVTDANLTDAITIENLTYPNLTPKFKNVKNIVAGDFNVSEFNGFSKIEIDNTGSASYVEGKINEMHMVYSYVNDSDEIVDQDVYFNLGLTQLEVQGPLTSLVSIKDNNSKNTTISSENVTLTRTGLEATTDEKDIITLNNKSFSSYYNGYNLSISYMVNETLMKLGDILNTENNRIITASVIGKEAKAVPVNVVFKVKVTDKYENIDRETIQNKLKASVMNYFNNYKLGDRVEESDLVGWLYTDTATSDIVNYVALPFDAFYIPDDATAPVITDESKRPENGILEIKSIEYPVLNISKFKIDII